MKSACPKCHSKASKRNGYTRHGKQNHRCLDCGKQFSLDLIETVEVDARIDQINLVEDLRPPSK